MLLLLAMLGAMAPPSRRVLRTHEAGGGASPPQLEPLDSHKLRALLLRKKGKREWQAACDMLWGAIEQQPEAVKPIHFNIVLASLAAATEWERCLVLLEHDMPSAGLEPDSYSYSSAISACAKAGEPGHAISLFKHMCAAGVAPNVITCNTVLSACQVSTHTYMHGALSTCTRVTRVYSPRALRACTP